MRKGHAFPKDQPSLNPCLGAFATEGRVRDPWSPPSGRRRWPVLGSGWVSSYLKARLTLQDFFLLGKRHSEQRAEVSSGPMVISKVLKILFTDKDFAPPSPLQLAQHTDGSGSVLAITLPSVLMKEDCKWQVPYLLRFAE